MCIETVGLLTSSIPIPWFRLSMLSHIVLCTSFYHFITDLTWDTRLHPDTQFVSKKNITLYLTNNFASTCSINNHCISWRIFGPNIQLVHGLWPRYWSSNWLLTSLLGGFVVSRPGVQFVSAQNQTSHGMKTGLRVTQRHQKTTRFWKVPADKDAKWCQWKFCRKGRRQTGRMLDWIKSTLQFWQGIYLSFQ